jgi:hypothetical protein
MSHATRRIAAVSDANGHTVQVSYEPGRFVTAGDKRDQLSVREAHE